MKRIMAVTGVTGAILLLVGCGRNDNMDMGGPGDTEYGSGSSFTERTASSSGVDTGINGTGPSGNGSGGTVSNMDTNEAAGTAPISEAGTKANPDAPQPGAQSDDQIAIDGGVSQDFSRTDTRNVNSGTEPQGSENPQ